MTRPWTVDGVSRPGVLMLRLSGSLAPLEMTEFVAAHNAAVDAQGDKPYRVFCDIRALAPLSPECAALFERAKAYSSAHVNFQGSAVLAQSQVVAMQHRRTSVAGGVWKTELLTDNEAACWAHLAKVTRNPGA